jgi:hypothetical protein
MGSVKDFVDTGIILKNRSFKLSYDNWFSPEGVQLYFFEMTKRYIVEVPTGCVHFKEFEPAYQYFLKFLDPKINPGIAVANALNAIRDRHPEFGYDLEMHFTEKNLQNEIKSVIIYNGWALEYSEQSAEGSCDDGWKESKCSL